MWTAILLLLLLLIFSLFSYSTVNSILVESSRVRTPFLISRSKFFLVLSFLLFYILMAFRDISVGIDTETYSELYLEIANSEIFFSSRYELGYVLLNKFIGFLFPHSPQVFFMIVSIFVLYGYARFIFKYSYITWLSVLFFFLFEYFDLAINLTRQSIAMVLVLYAYDFLITRRKKAFFLLIIIAGLFHYTALLFAIAYIVNFIKFNRQNILYSFVLIFFVYVFAEYFVQLAFGSIGIYADYANTVYADGNVRLASILNALVILIFIVFTLLNKQTTKKYFESKLDYANGEKMFWLIMLGLLIWVASFYFNQLGRLARYFTVFSIVYIPNLLYLIKQTHIRKYFYWNLFFCCFAIFYYLTIVCFRPEWNGVYPYKFFFL
ncbi:EpsG family protein [Bacteroides sp.]|uniref:EpsG family protein n=1 Tax=Bacteroides sp. TaxID=29523 RepID=UPI002638D722|nr:EpsG family protein [Bacteroides sp.]MDD3040118.1 EpsG family protein [Bacteroides sp.]